MDRPLDCVPEVKIACSDMSGANHPPFPRQRTGSGRLPVGSFIGLLFTTLVLVTTAFAQHDTAGVQVQRATFGAGCFWCVEAVFERIPGVRSVVSGYAGGTKEKPTDRNHSTTGHAEVVQMTFDSSVVSYERLLEVFWNAHDPTTMNRQGDDVGAQYRSIILYESTDQKLAAERSKQEAQRLFKTPIVTEIKPLGDFSEASSFHQDFYTNNPNAPYCRLIIKPKLKKMELEK